MCGGEGWKERSGKKLVTRWMLSERWYRAICLRMSRNQQDDNARRFTLDTLEKEIIPSTWSDYTVKSYPRWRCGLLEAYKCVQTACEAMALSSSSCCQVKVFCMVCVWGERHREIVASGNNPAVLATRAMTSRRPLYSRWEMEAAIVRGLLSWLIGLSWYHLTALACLTRGSLHLFFLSVGWWRTWVFFPPPFSHFNQPLATECPFSHVLFIGRLVQMCVFARACPSSWLVRVWSFVHLYNKV